MKINENDIRTLNRLMAAERLIREAMTGDEKTAPRTRSPFTA